MAKFKEKELRKLSEYEFSIKGDLNKIKRLTSILEQIPLEKITLSIIGYVAKETPDNLDVLDVESYSTASGKELHMRPKYHVLEDIAIDDPRANITDIGEAGKRIRFPHIDYSIVIFNNAPLKDEL